MGWGPCRVSWAGAQGLCRIVGGGGIRKVLWKLVRKVLHRKVWNEGVCFALSSLRNSSGVWVESEETEERCGETHRGPPGPGLMALLRGWGPVSPPLTPAPVPSLGEPLLGEGAHPPPARGLGADPPGGSGAGRGGGGPGGEQRGDQALAPAPCRPRPRPLGQQPHPRPVRRTSPATSPRGAQDSGPTGPMLPEHFKRTGEIAAPAPAPHCSPPPSLSSSFLENVGICWVSHFPDGKTQSIKLPCVSRGWASQPGLHWVPVSARYIEEDPREAPSAGESASSGPSKS